MPPYAEPRRERTGRLVELDQAITALPDAADAAPAGHPSQATMASNLGNALLNRFERTGDLVDLDPAIGRHRAATDAVPADHPSRPLWNVADREAPDMAASTYARLLDPDTGRPQSSRAPYALHHAVARLHRDRPGEPLLRAPYIHLGP